MRMTLQDLATPTVVIETDKMDANLRRMQSTCDDAGVELWPHVKTHKMLPVLRRQLELGAVGATCAKLGEAEALLPSGIRRLFLAHSLVDLRNASRLKILHEALDEFILAVTSLPQFDALEALLTEAQISVPVLLAIDTGLHREGARDPAQAAALADKIRHSSRMDLVGLYTHEGHAYSVSSPEEIPDLVVTVNETLLAARDAVGGGLSLWPGCSVTAALMARQPGVKVVRPGSYVFGDLFLTEATGVMTVDDVALTVLATVVDRPESGLALIDAGSKVFSGDKTFAGLSGRCLEHPSLAVTRVSEEHGFVTGEGVEELKIGQRLRFQVAHVCPVVNLAARVHVLESDGISESWMVDARGRSD